MNDGDTVTLVIFFISILLKNSTEALKIINVFFLYRPWLDGAYP